MFKYTLYIDIWSALYHLAISARSNAIVALVTEENCYRVLFRPTVSAANITDLTNQNTCVIVVNGVVTKNELSEHHADYFLQELRAASVKH